jgi:enoyl-[acyl-carrier protein] reductase II
VNNSVVNLFKIKYPIVQGGMVWVSGYKLASAVSNAGGLGLIGAGSMYPDVLRNHILKCQKATDKPFGVNIPLLYPDIEEHMKTVVELGVKIVFTSAGNPKTWTSYLKDNGITVVHVVSSLKFAIKAQEAGVDAVVAEGFEAGGHNGREESTTFTLIPLLSGKLNIPLIAAGGIASGKTWYAAEILGADGVQVGSRFALAKESSASEAFKQTVVDLEEGGTILTLKELAPVRMIKNSFYSELEALYNQNASVEDLKAHLGRGRAKKGILEGDLIDGELEIGQVSAYLEAIEPAEQIVKDMVTSYELLSKNHFNSDN